jgi:hypothetical protein
MSSFHRWTREATSEALQLLHQAIELDPDYATPHGVAASCYVLRKANGWSRDSAQEAAEAARLAHRAGELGKDDAVALCWGGEALAYGRGLKL